MKQKQEILSVLQTLDQFAASTQLPRQWHVQWQSLFNNVEVEVGEILGRAREEEKTKKTNA